MTPTIYADLIVAMVSAGLGVSIVPQPRRRCSTRMAFAPSRSEGGGQEFGADARTRDLARIDTVPASRRDEWWQADLQRSHV